MQRRVVGASLAQRGDCSLRKGWCSRPHLYWVEVESSHYLLPELAGVSPLFLQTRKLKPG